MSGVENAKQVVPIRIDEIHEVPLSVLAGHLCCHHRFLFRLASDDAMDFHQVGLSLGNHFADAVVPPRVLAVQKGIEVKSEIGRASCRERV